MKSALKWISITIGFFITIGLVVAIVTDQDQQHKQDLQIKQQQLQAQASQNDADAAEKASKQDALDKCIAAEDKDFTDALNAPDLANATPEFVSTYTQSLISLHQAHLTECQAQFGQ